MAGYRKRDSDRFPLSMPDRDRHGNTDLCPPPWPQDQDQGKARHRGVCPGLRRGPARLDPSGHRESPRSKAHRRARWAGWRRVISLPPNFAGSTRSRKSTRRGDHRGLPARTAEARLADLMRDCPVSTFSPLTSRCCATARPASRAPPTIAANTYRRCSAGRSNMA